MELIAFITALILLGLVAQPWGADSRDGRDWQPRPEDWAFPRRRPGAASLPRVPSPQRHAAHEDDTRRRPEPTAVGGCEAAA